MKYKMLITDLDGTLLRNDKTISTYTYDVLKKLHEQNVEIVVSSGRSFLSIPPCIRDLDLINYYICCNGANIKDKKNNNYIYKKEIKNETCISILNYVKQYDVFVDCSIDDVAYVERNKFEHLWENLHDKYLVDSISKSRKPHDDLYSEKRNFQKIEFFIQDDVFRTGLQQRLVDMYPDDIDAIVSYKTNFELGPKGANKGAASKFLCDYLHIDTKDIIVCGDNPNDIPALSIAGLKIVTANGDDRDKKIADILALNCNEDGIARAIDENVL